MSTVEAVIVIDMLDCFCKPGGSLYSERMQRIVEPIRTYLQKEMAAGARVIFLADAHAPDDPEFAMFPPHCIAGSGEEEIVAGLREIAERAIVLRKNTYSAFRGTELEQVLAEIVPDTVHVVGVCTDICVLHTVIELRQRQYSVTVHADMVETYDGPGHPAVETADFALRHMRDVLGARIV